MESANEAKIVEKCLSGMKSENTKFLTLEFMNFGIFIMSGFEKGYEVP
jgi:hypothetical protein